jgi:ABC-type dipeptide/oligopeptide/nickel transport systems, permease components
MEAKSKTDVNVELLTKRTYTYWQLVAKRLKKHKLAIASGIILIILILSCIFAPYLTPYNYYDIDLDNRFAPPSKDHIMGTSELGHDIFTRILYGGRISLLVGFASAFAAAVLGGVLGLVSGYYGGLLDNIIMRIADIFYSIPVLPLMLIIAKFLGSSVINIIFVIVVFGWMTVARIVRGMTLSLKQHEFIESARAIGADNLRIMYKHLLPNLMAPLIVSSTLAIGNAIIYEASLSFLGLGIQPPTPSWGNMLQRAQEHIWRAPWMAFWPGIFIFITVLCFNFLGDGLRDAMDPKLKI